MKMGIIDRLHIFIKYLKYSDREFAIKCGIAQNTMSYYLNDQRKPSYEAVEKILATFPDLSAEWLTRGNGEMLFPQKSDIDLPMEQANCRMETPTLNSKIREIITYYKLSDRQFAIKIGVAQSVIASMFLKGTEPSAKVIKNTLTTFPEISADWFLMDLGDMMRGKSKEAERIDILLDTIATLQETINAKSKNIHSLNEQIRQLENTIK